MVVAGDDAGVDDAGVEPVVVAAGVEAAVGLEAAVGVEAALGLEAAVAAAAGLLPDVPPPHAATRIADEATPSIKICFFIFFYLIGFKEIHTERVSNARLP
ncbi:hypothetical protein DWV00_03325 [Trinickia dinghuensis]|uniref:Uncharacterized protein n=1 Tax=Trinickia dinghuensis TaxID=2291023 RepID=A0A3D8K830_9BURK|nr:hypothetical protein DWV00_03325 [Trinickia dinghuensis]